MRPCRRSTPAVSSRISCETTSSNAPSSAKRSRSCEAPPGTGFSNALTSTVVSSTALGMLAIAAIRLHLFCDLLFLGLDVLLRVSLTIFHSRRDLLNSLPCALALHHGNWLQENAVLHDLRFQIVAFLNIQCAPHFGGERELRQPAHSHQRHMHFPSSAFGYFETASFLNS